MPLFDTHAHYYDEKFGSAEEQEKILSEVLGEVPHIINCGITPETSLRCLEWGKKYSGAFAACGLHPENLLENHCDNLRMLDEIGEMYSEEKCVAVGEIGLDYYWTDGNRNEQKEIFALQLEQALDQNLPVIIHDREAHGDTLDILSSFGGRGLRGVLHSFSGSPETAREVLKLGFYISFSGVITFKNALKPSEVLKVVPRDRILLETDCPYLAPHPFRGKINDSRLMEYTAEKMASVLETDADSIIHQCEKNAFELFSKCGRESNV